MTPKELLELAFRTARTKSVVKKIRNNLKFNKTIEIKKIELITDTINSNLLQMQKTIPRISELNQFYQELIDTTIGIAETKKRCAHLKKTQQILNKIKKQTINKIHRESKIRKIMQLRKEFYGRTISVMKKTEQSFETIETIKKELQSMPKIEFNAKTIIIAGCPNTGKSTLLQRLTNAKPEIKRYPFTTKNIQIGYIKEKNQNIQVIDTPGLLDRPAEKRNPIEKKAIAALKNIPSTIIFVIDPSTHSGYSLQEQICLMEEIKKEFQKKLLIVINKADIANREEIENTKKEIMKNSENRESVFIEGKKIKSDLKQKIIEL